MARPTPIARRAQRRLRWIQALAKLCFRIMGNRTTGQKIKNWLTDSATVCHAPDALRRMPRDHSWPRARTAMTAAKGQTNLGPWARERRSLNLTPEGHDAA